MAIAEVAAGTFSRALAQQFLGIAHVVRSEWDDAVAAMERALSIYRERDVGLEEESMSLAFLARVRLGRGDAAAALAAAGEAVRLASRRGTKAFEMHARHQRARALLAIGGRSAVAAAGDEIQSALALVEKTGGRSFEPRLHRELAELARLRGDETTRQHELRAERLIAEIGGAGGDRSLTDDAAELILVPPGVTNRRSRAVYARAALASGASSAASTISPDRTTSASPSRRLR